MSNNEVITLGLVYTDWKLSSWNEWNIAIIYYPSPVTVFLTCGRYDFMCFFSKSIEWKSTIAFIVIIIVIFNCILCAKNGVLLDLVSVWLYLCHLESDSLRWRIRALSMNVYIRRFYLPSNDSSQWLLIFPCHCCLPL